MTDRHCGASYSVCEWLFRAEDPVCLRCSLVCVWSTGAKYAIGGEAKP